MSERVLVVEDEAVLRANLVRYLQREGHDVEGVGSAEEALASLRAGSAGVVITDLRMPGLSGLDLLARIREQHPETLVIVMTAYASIESAVEALRQGAQDYLLKPVSLEELALRVERLSRFRQLEARVQRLRREVGVEHDTSAIVAASSGMREVLRLVGKVAPSRTTVLVEGESGTGKELVARALHDQAPWAERDFLAVNLAAVPRELVDATLFGHEKGAYTGAAQRRDGVFRAAAGGTVFLDEIGELPTDVQVKLLRVLENREVLPIGADRAVPVDVRLVTATNRSLKKQVDEGRFRADLYYRLNVVRIEVPPLRDRPDDVVPLAERFLRRHAERLGRAVPALGADVARTIVAYEWPGNVRELSNVIERAVLLADTDRIGLEDLPADLAAVPGEVLGLKEATAAFELRHVRRVLRMVGGDKAKAAEVLGIHLATLYRHLERAEG